MRSLLRIAVLLIIAGLAVPFPLAAQETDFSVGWISRLPKIDYVPGSAAPDVEGWPERYSLFHRSAGGLLLGSRHGGRGSEGRASVGHP